jgi:serine/threonine protein kinase
VFANQTSDKFVFNIPQLVCDDLPLTAKGKSSLKLYPECQPVQPCANGCRVIGDDIAKLVEILQWLHEQCGICHRDIKPNDIFIRSEAGRKEIYLNDFGSAVTLGSKVPWEGTIGYYEKPSEYLHVPDRKDDLIALAKSAYLMLYNEVIDFSDMESGQAWDMFWNERLQSTELWRQILQSSTFY